MSKVFFILIIFSVYFLDFLSYCSHSGNNGMGTVLFTASDLHKECWSPEEIALMTTRMILENLLPDVKILTIDSDDYVNDIVDYFRLLINVVRKMSCGRKKHITMMALTDLLGGYLQHAVLPIARQAYYAGILEYSSMERLMQLYEELKWFLRTNGQGWATPTDKETDFDIQSIDLNTETSKCNKSSCRNLIYYRHEPSKKRSATDTDTARYFFPIPFLDAKVHPTAIAVPFKKFALRNIESKKAAHLVMKFFIAVEMCFKDAHACEETVTKFHNNLYTWIEKEVIPKLKDDKFYSAFGGILRVEETLKSLGATVNEEKAVEEEGEEELGAVPGGETTSRSRTVLMAMLIIIFVWFIIGTLFICYRMRANNLKGRPCKGPKSDGTCSTTTGSRWSLLTRSSSRKMSSETCKCCSSTEKSTTKRSSNTSEPTTQSSEQEEPQKDSKRLSFSSPCVCDGYAIIDTKHSMKLLPSIPELSENSTVKKQSSKTRKITFDAAADNANEINKRNKRKVCVPDMEEVELVHCGQSEQATSMTSGSRNKSDKKYSSEGETTDETAITANSPHIYACHSSLTGNYTIDQRHPIEKPYIFGYDFQTSSSSDVSEDDTDGKTTSTKYRCIDD